MEVTSHLPIFYSTTSFLKSSSASNAGNTTEILKEIPVDLVQKNDILKVLPGARIPTDGYILTGSAFIDESMITGESLPTLHIQGDAVFGSTVNQQSTIYIKATAVGTEVT